MQVIDEVTGKKINKRDAFLVVTDVDATLIDGGKGKELIYGYTAVVEKCPPCIIFSGIVRRIVKDKLKDKIIYSNRRGIYMTKSSLNFDRNSIQREEEIKGSGTFPYNDRSLNLGIDRNYEAIESFQKFEGKQELLKDTPDRLSEFMDYTFGIEYETSCGYIPEDICYRDGLIPLRDGSITGIEYSTVVLQGNKGISAMKQQVETLKKYTLFDKDCSLHMHFGGYPQDPDKLYALYLGCYGLQHDIAKLVPELTFRSGEYKSSGKDYCKQLRYKTSFNDMYKSMTGRDFFGSLDQPHPNDISRKRKWQVGSRYYYVNFINALCYTVNKTIEWRLLRPTYNTEKIITWMYIFNGIMKYCDKNAEAILTHHNAEGSTSYPTSLVSVLQDVYPEDICIKLIDNIRKLRKIKELQMKTGDYIGARTDIEDRVFAEPPAMTYEEWVQRKPGEKRRTKTPTRRPTANEVGVEADTVPTDDEDVELLHRMLRESVGLPF